MALQVGAGHSFIIILRNAYPINILHRIREVPEVVNIYAASANPLLVVLAESEQGKGILGVIDGFSPKGVETEQNVTERRQFLRNIGYKQ